MQKKLVIFTAPSGAGKTTIVRQLLALNSNLAFSISAATRKKRENEMDGRDYYFISGEEFKKRVARGEFLEWEEVYRGIFYGTLKSEVERLWNLGKTVVFDIDVQGALNLKKIYGSRALSVFVKPPSHEVLIERLKARATENEFSLQLRITKAESELAYESKFDAVIVNDDLQETVRKAEKLVTDFCRKEQREA